MFPTPRPSARVTGLTLLGLIVLTGCSEDGKVPIPDMPNFDDDHLGAGRSVWMNACRSCHLVGINDVLGVTQFDQWDQRLAKGWEPLYQSVLQGMTNPDGAIVMPPRGGDLQLSDEQLRAALDYHLAAINALRAKWTP